MGCRTRRFPILFQSNHVPDQECPALSIEKITSFRDSVGREGVSSSEDVFFFGDGSRADERRVTQGGSSCPRGSRVLPNLRCQTQNCLNLLILSHFFSFIFKRGASSESRRK